jgi:hypothetical protein
VVGDDGDRPGLALGGAITLLAVLTVGLFATIGPIIDVANVAAVLAG